MDDRIGRYRLVRRIGAGGMAEIWKAKIEGPAGFAKTFAVKRILSEFAADDEFIAMFIDEAKLVAQLDHPNIVQVVDFGEVPEKPGDYFLAMAYVPGQNYATLISRLTKAGKKLPTEIGLYVALESAKALAYAHAAQDESGQALSIVHRDVSPHNILVSYKGEVKVADFGIAKVATAVARTATGVFKGKLAYMSPEQARIELLDGRSDVFSLGIVMYESLVGKRLFGERSAEEIRAHVLTFKGPNAADMVGVPLAVQEVLRHALAGDRDARPDARRLETELARALGATGSTTARDALAALMKEVFPKELEVDLEDGGTRSGQTPRPAEPRPQELKPPELKPTEPRPPEPRPPENSLPKVTEPVDFEAGGKTHVPEPRQPAQPDPMAMLPPTPPPAKPGPMRWILIGSGAAVAFLGIGVGLARFTHPAPTPTASATATPTGTAIVTVTVTATPAAASSRPHPTHTPTPEKQTPTPTATPTQTATPPPETPSPKPTRAHVTPVPEPTPPLDPLPSGVEAHLLKIEKSLPEDESVAQKQDAYDEMVDDQKISDAWKAYFKADYRKRHPK